jgi:hypothetical protein
MVLDRDRALVALSAQGVIRRTVPLEGMAMTPVQFVVIAFAASMPTADLDTICQGAKLAALPGDDQTSTVQGCLRDEKTARDDLRQKWSHFSADAHETCAVPKGVAFSYVELLTCLEMQPGSAFNSPPMPASDLNAPDATRPKP